MKHMPVGVSVVYCITWDPYSIPKSLIGAKIPMVIFGRPARWTELLVYLRAAAWAGPWTVLSLYSFQFSQYRAPGPGP